MAAARRLAQLFVELRSEDPEAASALGVARASLVAGRALVSLRRLRVLEFAGALPETDVLAEKLHASTQFHNPAKERCTLRTAEDDPAPIAAEEALVLVVERGGERRPTAERWWRGEMGKRVEVREGVVWVLRFAAGADPGALAEALAVTRDRAHGLFSNPHFQDHRVCVGGVPALNWMTRRAGRAPRRGGGSA
jgi:hypothetical protein